MKYKFRFYPKLPSFCNHASPTEVVFCTFSSHWI